MRMLAQGGARELDAALAAALEAAAERVRQRAGVVVTAARLATTVHMRRVAESTAAQAGLANGQAAALVHAPHGAGALGKEWP